MTQKSHKSQHSTSEDERRHLGMSASPAGTTPPGEAIEDAPRTETAPLSAPAQFEHTATSALTATWSATHSAHAGEGEATRTQPHVAQGGMAHHLHPQAPRGTGAGAERVEMPGRPHEVGLTRAVTESLGEGVYTLDTQGNVTYMNPAAERLLGWHEAELLGRNIHQMTHYLRPDGTPLPEEECPLRSVLRSGEIVRRDDDVFVRKDGRAFAVSYTSAPLIEHGEVTGAVLAFSDRSAARHEAQRQAVQYAVSQVLAEATAMQDAVGALLEHIGKGLGWDVGTFWLVEGDLLRCVAGWQEEAGDAAPFLAASMRAPLPRGIGVPGRAWQEAEPTWVANVEVDTNFPRVATAHRAGLHTALAFPITGPGGVIGVIEFLQRGIIEYDLELAQTVGTLGNQIGQAFERIRYEEALRAGEARTQAIINTAPDAIVSIDERGTILEFNPAAERIFGYARADVLGRPMTERIIPPDLREQHNAGMARYLATGEEHILNRPIDTEGLHADGHRMPVELAVTRIPGTGPVIFTAHLRDITRRKQEEAERQRNLQATALRADISSILAESAPLDQQAQRCVEAIVRHLDVALARIWLLDEEDGVLNLTASAGLSTHGDGEHARITLGDLKIGRIALTRTPHLTNDVAHDPQMSDPDWVLREGLVAFAGYPLIASDHVVGVVALFARELLDQNTLDALANIADLIAQGIARQRAEDEREHVLRLERRARTQAETLSARLQAVQTITEPMLASLSLDRFLPEMLRRVREVLQVHGVSVLLLDDAGQNVVVRASEGLEVQGGIGTAIPVGQGIAGRIAATRQPMIVDDLHSVQVHSPYLRSHARSLLGVPLVVDGQLLGVLHVSTLHRHHFTKNEQHLLQLVADRVSSALERTRLYEAEQQAHADTLALQQRFALLAEVGNALTASLNYEQALSDLAWTLVPKLTDWCYVDILNEEGHIERLALAGANPEQMRRLGRVRARYPLEESPEHPVNRVIASGESILLPEVDPENITILLDDEVSRQIIREIGITSAIIVPLRTREEVFGALTLTMSGSHRHYGPSDLALAQEIARRAAIAIENARLYRKTERALHQVGEIADQLLMQATQLDTIIEAIPGPVFVCDATGMITRANPSGAVMLGGHPDQGMAPISYVEAARDMFYPDGTLMPAEETPLARALRGETRTDFRFMMRRFDTDEEVQLLASFAPTRDSHQQVSGAVVVASDISEIYRLERQKDDFLSIASHELKTPLTSLKILAQVTQRRLDRSGATEVAQVRDMGRSIVRMERLVSDLLDVTRIHGGKLALRPETFDLVTLVRQIAAEQHAATDREMHIDAPDDEISITADPERLGQVFTNLLSNAAKYSPPGLPVDVRVERIDDAARISIHDSGGGIPEEARTHLFERFYRVPGIEVQSGSGVGLGLGLYISREIVERHSGTITVESSPEQGTTFTVTVPLHALAESPESA